MITALVTLFALCVGIIWSAWIDRRRTLLLDAEVRELRRRVAFLEMPRAPLGIIRVRAKRPIAAGQAVTAADVAWDDGP